ncbi:MAG TPA: hypothetical protein VGL27_00955 [Negativicutes bacterium]|jgi:hypothetical protein
MKLKATTEVEKLQQEIYDLLGSIDAKRLPFVKSALELIAAGRVYDPNAILIPELENPVLNEDGEIEGKIVGYVPTIFHKGNKLLM